MAVAKHETRAPLYFIARKVFQRCQIQTTLPPSFLARVFKRVRDTHGRERSSSNPDGGWGKAKKAFVTRAGYPPHHPHPPLPMSDTGGGHSLISPPSWQVWKRGAKKCGKERVFRTHAWSRRNYLLFPRCSSCQSATGETCVCLSAILPNTRKTATKIGQPTSKILFCLIFLPAEIFFYCFFHGRRTQLTNKEGKRWFLRLFVLLPAGYSVSLPNSIIKNAVFFLFV